jgi:cyclophilin family peptidyl-prolyl cis-trans isomerase
MGPYYVQITAKTRGDKDDSAVSFVVELASRRDMPHSVFSFLSLVSYEMYDGTTTFVLPESDDSGIVGLSMTMDAEVAFNQKRRAVGMKESILMFPESSPRFPCEEHSVGFQGLGLSLEFYLSSPGESSSKDEQSSCFGKIVRGVEKLQFIQESVSNGIAVDITHMQHLLL